MPRPVNRRNPAASVVYRFAAGIAFLLMRLQRWRFDVRDAHHLPEVGGAVIAANHTSFVDFFTTGRHAYLEQGRPVRILAKESLFRVPVFGWFMRRAEHIPVHRGAGGRALASAVEALQRGELVLVLPEQTISPAFELLTFKRGAARMAAAAGVPLIPAVSWGTHRFATVGRRPRFRWRLPVTIHYGEPMYPQPDDDLGEVLVELRLRIERLLHHVQSTYPDGAPRDAWWVPARLGGGAPPPDEVRAFLESLRQGWGRRPAGRDERA